jgi:hypothetical protein
LQFNKSAGLLFYRLYYVIFNLLTSTCIRCLFLSGYTEGGIEKMRSKFFQRVKSCAVAGTLPPAVEAKATG